MKHSPSCPWRTGGECFCGGNPRWAPKAPADTGLTICPTCTDDPCSCAQYAAVNLSR